MFYRVFQRRCTIFNIYDDKPFSEVFCVNPEEFSDVSVLAVGFSTRVCNRLMRSHVTTISEFLKLSMQDLINMKGFGQGCVEEVQKYLENLKTSGGMML